MMERDSYLGRILTGRISSGIIRVGDKVHGIRLTDYGVQKIEEGKVKIMYICFFFYCFDIVVHMIKAAHFHAN